MKIPFLFARRFIAGETFEEAINAVHRLNQQSIEVTLDLLGENVTDRQAARATVDDYIQLLYDINASKIHSTISIKLTMIGLDISRDFCSAQLFRLLDAAESLNQFVRIDMEGSDYTEQTIDLFREAHRHYENHVGIVLQASLHRTASDLDSLVHLHADIRLCKGAYKEPPGIAHQHMGDIREAFKQYAKTLLDKTPYPRFATHDDQLIDWIKSYSRQMNIPKNRFEFQMLFGLREETMAGLVKEGYRARVYVPYGTMWLPYFKRRLTERKENIWFVLTNLWKK